MHCTNEMAREIKERRAHQPRVTPPQQNSIHGKWPSPRFAGGAALSAGMAVLFLAATPAPSPADTLFVANTESQNIIRLDSSGTNAVFVNTPGLFPRFLAFDNAGNLFVASDRANNSCHLAKYDPSGAGTVLLDTQGQGAPRGLAFDSAGNLYMALLSPNTNAILRLDSCGNWTAITDPLLNQPCGLAIDSAGYLYVANEGNSTIVKFDRCGATVFANSMLTRPTALAFDNHDNLYVPNADNNTLVRFDPTGVGTAFASAGLLNKPCGIAFDSNGNLYAANNHANNIAKFDPSGTSTVFASGLNGPEGMVFKPIFSETIFVANTESQNIIQLDSSGTNTVFAKTAGLFPRFLAFDNAGNVYASFDRANNSCYLAKYDPSGASTVLMDTQGQGAPRGLAVDSAGNLYISLLGPDTNCIMRMDPRGLWTAITDPLLNQPCGLAFDSAGGLYVANEGSNNIVKFVQPGAGPGAVFASSLLTRPTALAFDNYDNLYVPNADNDSLVRFDPAGVGTVFASAGLLDKPFGVAFDSNGNLYVANNHANNIVKFAPCGVGTVFASGLNGPEGLASRPAIRVSPGLYAGLVLNGIVGSRWVIQRVDGSLGAAAWTTVTTITLRQPAQFWVDTTVDISRAGNRFYRVVPAP